MRTLLAVLLLGLAVLAWGRVAMDRIAGGTVPAATLGEVFDIPAPPPGWDALHDLWAALSGLEAGSAALAAALAVLMIDLAVGRRR